MIQEKKSEMPDNWWDYGINPILGYRYQPDGKSKTHKIRILDAASTTTKS